MVRHWTRLGLALAMAACALPSSSVLNSGALTVDEYTRRQLTAAAGTLVRYRSQALVHSNRERRRIPHEVLGVVISPQLARVQESAVRELENRNRAPVAGGPAFTGARTRLDAARAVREGDRITLDAVEHTEVRYGSGKLVQSVRRRFEFTAVGDAITLTGERVVDPDARPINDPDPRDR